MCTVTYIQYLTKVSTPLTFQQQNVYNLSRDNTAQIKLGYILEYSMCSLYISTNLLYSKYNSTYNHYCPKNWQQNEYTLSEHVKTVSKKCQFFVGAPLLSRTALILLDMEHQSCTGCCWHPLPLLYNGITELLDVRHMVLLHLLLEDAPHVLNRVQVWRHTWPLHHLHLQQQSSCHLGGVFGKLCWKTVSEGRPSSSATECHSTLESMFPSMNRRSPVPAQFYWYSSPGRRHTCWTPSDHRTWFQ